MSVVRGSRALLVSCGLAIAGTVVTSHGGPASATPTACAESVLFVAGAVPAPAGDAALLDEVRERDGSGCVTVVADDDATAESAAGFDAVVISSSVTPAIVDNTFAALAKPVLVSEPALFVRMGMATVPGRDDGTARRTVFLSDLGAVPTYAGVPGVVAVFASPVAANSVREDRLGSGATVIARTRDGADDVVLFLYEAGAPMVGVPAPSPRVGFFAPYGARLTPAGRALLDASLDAAVGRTDANVAVLVAGNTKPPLGDRPIVERLESAGFDVRIVDDDADLAALDLTAVDLVVISGSVVPSNVGGALHDAALPVITAQGSLFDEMGLTKTGASTTAMTTVSIARAGDGAGTGDWDWHPMRMGETAGPVAVYTAAARLSYGRRPGADAAVIAYTGTPDRAVLLAYDAGDELYDGSRARAVRIGLFATATGAQHLTAAGTSLIDGAIAYATAEAPANDDFASATPIGDDLAVEPADAAGATTEPGEPLAFVGAEASTWWTWTAPADGRLVVDTSPSGWEPRVGLWSGSSISDLVLVGTSGHMCTGMDGPCPNVLDLPVAGGRTYHLAAYSSGLSRGVVDLSVRFEPLAGATTWHFQLIVYESVDATLPFAGLTRHLAASMTAAERDEFIERARMFVEDDLPVLSSGNAVGVLEVTVADRALTTLQPLWGGYSPGWPNVQPELNPQADAVMVVYDPRAHDVDTGESLWIGAAAGLAWPRATNQLYTEFIIDNVTYNDGLRNTNVLKHEYGHSFVFFHDALGVAPKPAVDNHSAQYVHCGTGAPYVWVDEFTSPYPYAVPNSIYNDASGFHHDIYSGTSASITDPTRCLGITAAAWRAGTPTTLGIGPTLAPMGEPVAEPAREDGVAASSG